MSYCPAAEDELPHSTVPRLEEPRNSASYRKLTSKCSPHHRDLTLAGESMRNSGWFLLLR